VYLVGYKNPRPVGGDYLVKEVIAMTKRAGTMTERERWGALLRREKPDRVPILMFDNPGFCTVYAGYGVAEAYNNPQLSLGSQRKACQDFGWVCTPNMGYASMGGWEFGGEVKWPLDEFSQAPTVARHPADTPEEALKLQVPDVKTSGSIPIVMEFNKLALQEASDNDNEPLKALFYVASPFTNASNIVGADKFCKWMYKAPEAANHLLRISTDYIIEIARYWKDTFGTENVLAAWFDPTSSNQVISAKQFERFDLPYLKELHEAVLGMGYRHIYVHICGEQNLNLPFWAQVPFGDPGFRSFGHEVDLEKAGEYFPNDVIVGNVEPAIIQVGKPEQVYEACRKCIEKGKKAPGGFALACGCDGPPKAPAENMMMMTKAANDFGWYD